MSALWQVEVIDVAAAKARLRVRSIHPDSGGFVASKPLALRWLLDKAYVRGEDRVWRPAGPLGTLLSRDQTISAQAIEATVNQVIGSVAVSDLVNAPFDEASAKRRIEEELRARGLDPQNQEEWQAQLGLRWDEIWTDPSRSPAATYTIEVTDPRWLAHLLPGQRWESAAYA